MSSFTPAPWRPGRPQIDDIGDHDQSHQRTKKPSRIIAADIAGDAESGDPADAGADFLDRGHERIGEQQVQVKP